jgi:hypothetical protein
MPSASWIVAGKTAGGALVNLLAGVSLVIQTGYVVLGVGSLDGRSFGGFGGKEFDLEVEGAAGEWVVGIDGDGIASDGGDRGGTAAGHSDELSDDWWIGQVGGGDVVDEAQIGFTVGIGGFEVDGAAVAGGHLAESEFEGGDELPAADDEDAGTASTGGVEDFTVVEGAVEVEFDEISVVEHGPVSVLASVEPKRTM